MPSAPLTYYTYPTAFGPLTIGCTGEAVAHVTFGEAQMPGERRPSTASTEAANQIMEYLAGKRTTFDVALAPAGTDFQQAVWQAAANIPYGHTATARDIAAALGAPRSNRSVGAALKKCPTPLLIPIHRVVSASGKPLGSGQAASIASALVKLESSSKSQ